MMGAVRLPRYHGRRPAMLGGLHWNNWMHKHRVMLESVAVLATAGAGLAVFGGGAGLLSAAGSVASGAGSVGSALLPAATQLGIAKMKVDMETKGIQDTQQRQPQPMTGGIFSGGGGGGGIGGSGFSLAGLSGVSTLMKNPLILAGGAAILAFLLWPKSASTQEAKK